MGQVFYRDWEPGSFQDPTYNPAGAQPQLESWQPYVPRALPFQPVDYLDNRSGLGPWALANVQRNGYTINTLIGYPDADENLRFAPEQPIRRDVFMQLAQRAQSPNVSGTAPTKGIYTGVAEFE